MMILCFAATAVLAVWLAAQLYWISQFSRLLRAARSSAAIEDELPKIAVVLSLRGADPFLDRCLKGLLAQNYPSYEVQIVVDSELDPAWDLVHRLAGDCRAPFVRIEALKVRRRTCGLRISSLIQAVSSLDETYGAVVLVDADVVPHANWLRELVSPMRDPAVGATTGIRWYMPEAHNPGTLVRYLWNAAAIPQMQAFGIGWGGSLAIRSDLLSDANLLDKWSQILFEDTFTANEVRKLGRKVEFVPAATMVNREFVDLRSGMRFISRQMLNVRLYHDSWMAIMMVGMVSTAAVGTLAGMGVYSALAGDWSHALAAGGVLAGYGMGLFLGLACWERWIRQIVRSRGESTTPLTLNLLWAVPLTQIAYLFALFVALWTRKVEWRGITYRLQGPSMVHLVEYRPYQPIDQDARVPMSL